MKCHPQEALGSLALLDNKSAVCHHRFHEQQGLLAPDLGSTAYEIYRKGMRKQRPLGDLTELLHRRR